MKGFAYGPWRVPQEKHAHSPLGADNAMKYYGTRVFDCLYTMSQKSRPDPGQCLAASLNIIRYCNEEPQELCACFEITNSVIRRQQLSNSFYENNPKLQAKKTKVTFLQFKACGNSFRSLKKK